MEEKEPFDPIHSRNGGACVDPASGYDEEDYREIDAPLWAMGKTSRR
jgi:hypothetical protein